MKQVEIGAKELMVLGSKKEMMLIAEQNLAMSGEKGVTIVSASGETVIKGTMVQLNPPSAKSDSAEEQKAEPSDASIDSEAALEHDVEDTLLGSADEEGEEFGYPDVSGGEGEIGGDGGGDGAGGATRAMEIGKFAEQGGGVLAAVAGGLSKGDRGDRSKESTDDSGKDLERQPGKSLEGLGLSDDKPGDLLEGGSGEDRILLAGNPTRQKLTPAQEEQIRVLREEAMKGVAEGTKEGEWGNNLQRAAAFMHGFSSTATPTYSALVALMRVTGIINANEYNEMSKPSAELAVGTFLGAIVGYAAATSAETAGANLLVSKNGLRWFTGRGGESLVQLINPISGRRLTMTIKEFYDLSVLFSTAAGGAVNISF